MKESQFSRKLGVSEIPAMTPNRPSLCGGVERFVQSLGDDSKRCTACLRFYITIIRVYGRSGDDSFTGAVRTDLPFTAHWMGISLWAVGPNYTSENAFEESYVNAFIKRANAAAGRSNALRPGRGRFTVASNFIADIRVSVEAFIGFCRSHRPGRRRSYDRRVLTDNLSPSSFRGIAHGDGIQIGSNGQLIRRSDWLARNRLAAIAPRASAAAALYGVNGEYELFYRSLRER
ncbi:hypothetical protein EVAR_65571_1 [Eumeta japonica]|uniref:Uncharacterized protein n=1 Tax=Eumeta variegata TaxID=151549 RepID=A0A4C1ZDG7_EUMVA|nr:hypothetical protein EVAR_65571_1 [Eumeta japonica]